MELKQKQQQQKSIENDHIRNVPQLSKRKVFTAEIYSGKK